MSTSSLAPLPLLLLLLSLRKPMQRQRSLVSIWVSLFSKGRVKDALVQFEIALSLDANPMEAQAALYYKACCHASRSLHGKTIVVADFSTHMRASEWKERKLLIVFVLL